MGCNLHPICHRLYRRQDGIQPHDLVADSMASKQTHLERYAFCFLSHICCISVYLSPCSHSCMLHVFLERTLSKLFDRPAADRFDSFILWSDNRTSVWLLGRIVLASKRIDHTIPR